mmetsp:Transcript_16324/g.39142  ORF Transcript_16324/g.39142 Transcript_16324/m.39142 type:complete len:239 (-) Transcript_16324:1488-2204(-)
MLQASLGTHRQKHTPTDAQTHTHTHKPSPLFVCLLVHGSGRWSVWCGRLQGRDGQRQGGLVQPGQEVGVALCVRLQLGTHLIVVVVQIQHLVPCEQVEVDEFLLYGNHGEVLKAVVVTTVGEVVPGLGLDDGHQILNPDAPLIGLIVAGLVGHDHPRLQRHRARPAVALGGDADGPLMHTEEGPHAMAGAVEVVQADLPEVLPGQAVQLSACRGGGEDAARHCYVAFEHPCEALLLFL